MPASGALTEERPSSAMAAPPVTPSSVPAHHTGAGQRRCASVCSSPAQIGPLPMAMAVPSATPLAFTPAKKLRLYAATHTPASSTERHDSLRAPTRRHRAGAASKAKKALATARRNAPTQ